MTKLDHAQRLYFRDALREARANALRDAEGFDEIIHVIERLGGLLRIRVGDRSNGGLGKALQAIAPLVEDIAVAAPIENRGFHMPFTTLSRQVTEARNDAFHEGAFARHLTGDAIVLALTVEDALMAQSRVVSDYMIRQPVCAYLWQPLSFIRQTMLAHSYSYLPVDVSENDEADWRLLSDADVAIFTRTAQRNERLRMSLKTAMQSGLDLQAPYACGPETSIEEALQRCQGRPVLVTSRKPDTNSTDANVLVGFATPFDLL